MSDRDNGLLIGDMLQAARKIEKYTTGLTYDDFLADEKTIDAVVRNFEIIGEASSRLDPEFRSKHPEVNWRQLSGLRNRLIHAYFGVDYLILWTIIGENLTDLIEQLDPLGY